MPTTRAPFGQRYLVSTTPEPVQTLVLEPAGPVAVAPYSLATSPGTVGTVTGDMLRYAAFWRSTMSLERPQGSISMMSSGLDLPTNRNNLAEGMRGDWLFCLDDDIVVTPTTLTRLLATMERGDWDIVAAFSLRRVPPFDSLVYVEDPLEAECPPWVPDGRRGVMEIAACGMGGVLIHKRVFDALEKPYFRVGQVDPSHYHEDVEFCHRARLAGFRIAVDLDTPVGHVSPFAVWPARDPSGQQIVALAGPGGEVVPVDASLLRASMVASPALVGF